MPSRLNVESKRALLEQAIRIRTKMDEHSGLFLKLLSVNNYFINVSRCYKICQLVIDITPYSKISIFFGSDHQNRTKTFTFSAEKTRQLIDLFQVNVLKIGSLLIAKDKLIDYCSLVDSFQGEIYLNFHNDQSWTGYSEDLLVDIVNGSWNKISTFRGPPKFLSLCQPSKRFEKLCIFEVNTIADLKRVLRHEVNELEIEYIGELSMDDVNSFLITAKKTNIKKCKLIRCTRYGEMDVIVPLVHCIVGISPKCQKIEVSISISQCMVAFTIDQLIEDIEHDCDVYVKAKNLLRPFPFKLDLSVSSWRDTALLYEDVGDKWIDLVKKKKPILLDSVWEVKCDEYDISDEIVLHNVDGKLTSVFTVSVHYRSNEEDFDLQDIGLDESYEWD